MPNTKILIEDSVSYDITYGRASQILNIKGEQYRINFVTLPNNKADMAMNLMSKEITISNLHLNANPETGNLPRFEMVPKRFGIIDGHTIELTGNLNHTILTINIKVYDL